MSQDTNNFAMEILSALGVDPHKVYAATIHIEAGMPIVVETKTWATDGNSVALKYACERFKVYVESIPNV